MTDDKTKLFLERVYEKIYFEIADSEMYINIDEEKFNNYILKLIEQGKKDEREQILPEIIFQCNMGWSVDMIKEYCEKELIKDSKGSEQE